MSEIEKGTIIRKKTERKRELWELKKRPLGGRRKTKRGKTKEEDIKIISNRGKRIEGCEH